jgi:hypothetical protein
MLRAPCRLLLVPVAGIAVLLGTLAGCGSDAKSSARSVSEGRATVIRFLDLAAGPDASAACDLLDATIAADVRRETLNSFTSIYQSSVAALRRQLDETRRATRTCASALAFVAARRPQRLREVRRRAGVLPAAHIGPATDFVVLGDQAWVTRKRDGRWRIVAANDLWHALP